MYYVDFNFYSNHYNGKVQLESFDPLKNKATRILDYYTFNRIKEVDNNIRYAMCELIDLLEKEQSLTDGVIESETVGSYSVKYASNNNSNSISKKQREILNMWLPSELLYRGIRGVRNV